MGSSSSGGDSTTTTIRYAAYIETKHSDFLDTVASNREDLIGSSGSGTVLSKTEWVTQVLGLTQFAFLATYIATGDNLDAEYAEYVAAQETTTEGKASPFASYNNIYVDVGFFGTGYTLASFPSLYDMFGKFMAGLDIDALYSQIFENVTNSPEVNALVAAESALMDDDIVANSLPRIELGSRDINSNMSSTFVNAKGIVEDGKVKALAKFSAQLKYNLISVAQAVWQTHLEWNRGVVGVYSEIMKFYFSAKTDIDEINYAMAAKHALWPFTVLDFERACLGALQGATVQKTDVAGASTASRVLSGALSGAAMGAMVGAQVAPSTVAGVGGATVTSAGGAGYGAVGGAILGIGAALTY